MRRRSVKVRLTIWYTALMVLMAALVLAFVAMISSSVASQSSRTYLSQVVRGNLDQVSLVDGSLQLGEEFTFLQDGVYTVVYSQSGALLAGQLPQPFSTVSEPFVNGLTRPVDTDQGEYYVLDFWVPSGGESGVWVRGLMEVSEGNRTLYSLLLAAAIAMPGFILLAALAILCWLDTEALEGLLPDIMSKLSLFERFYVFVNGVFDMTGIVYYLSVIVFFLFLSVQSLEKRRYN